jgi:hypothetical protein
LCILNKIRPPVRIGESVIGSIDGQVEVSVVAPEHKHLPFMHAPFWLQFDVHVLFAEQYKEKSEGHVRVPVRPREAGAGMTCYGVKQTSLASPIKINRKEPDKEHTLV